MSKPGGRCAALFLRLRFHHRRMKRTMSRNTTPPTAPPIIALRFVPLVGTESVTEGVDVVAGATNSVVWEEESDVEMYNSGPVPASILLEYEAGMPEMVKFPLVQA